MAAKKKGKQTIDDILVKFEQAMKALHGSDFKKADTLFSEIMSSETNRPEIVEKAHRLQLLCERKLEKSDGKKAVDNPEVIYNQGIFCHNNGNFEEALDYFKQSLKVAGEKLDYVYYAMAATHAVQGRHEDALESLKEAIDLDVTHRIHAISDPDFNSLAEEESFKAIIEE